jgi:hypothetical protein
MPIVLPTYPIRIQEANALILRQRDIYANTFNERNRDISTTKVSDSGRNDTIVRSGTSL